MLSAVTTIPGWSQPAAEMRSRSGSTLDSVQVPARWQRDDRHRDQLELEAAPKAPEIFRITLEVADIDKAAKFYAKFSRH